MIIGLGTDIVGLDRIQKIYNSYGMRFLAKIFTKNEMGISRAQRIEFIAGRWAAKEAASKALGTGFSHGLTMLDIEITNSSSGCPQLFFYGEAALRAQLLGVKNKFISISHDRLNAVATVILEV